MVGVVCDKALERYDHRGKPALHVGRTATVDASVPKYGFKRVAVPFPGGARWNDVRMAGKAQHRTGVSAAGIQVADVPEGHRFTGEAQRRKTPGYQLLAPGIVGRDRWSADQLRQEHDRRMSGRILGRSSHQFSKNLITL